MLYEITVFKEMGNKKQRIYTKEIRAINSVIALERACIRLGPSRICEIRELPDPERIYPKINRIERDGTT